MCGLWGAASSILLKEEKENVAFLASLSWLRGIDSTGVAVLGRGKKNRIKISTERALTNPLNFVLSEQAKKAFNINESYLIMGHNRWSTIGAVNEYNAHPIEEKHIILCHNGSIDAFCRDKKSEVNSDSRELARRLGNKKLEVALGEADSGAYAISWVDLNKGTLNFARNSSRPLYFMATDNGATLYWASEMWMLNALRQKEGYKDFKDPTYLQTDYLFSLRLGTTTQMCRPLLLEKPKAQNSTQLFVRPQERSRAMCIECKKDQSSCDCSPFLEDGDTYDTSGNGIFVKKDPSVPLLPPPPKKVPELTAYPGLLYKYYEGRVLTVGAVLPRLKKGCAGCMAKAKPTDTTKWFTPDEFVCVECYEGNPVVNDYIVKNCKVYDSSLISHRMH